MNQTPNNLENLASDMLIAFYLGEFPDAHGRMIETIWSWDYQRLEYTHNYIQWLFPLKERSHFNPRAPVLKDETIAAFRASEPLQQRLLQSFRVMLKFYGLQFDETNEGEIKITKSVEYSQRKRVWLSPDNHNYLRITRILTSLRLLGLELYAQAFFNCLDQIYQEEAAYIGRETYHYWCNAV